MNIIELTEKQSIAFEAMKTGKNVFLTGPGGSGKSFLLKHFIDWYNNENECEDNDIIKIFVTSTTGLSSILIDGMTIHRYSGIGTGEKDIETLYKKIMKMKNLKNRWQNTDILIIDEISMMDPEIFDKLEILARKIRKNESPFGGIQIILSGDFLQLPPVKSDNFCFESFSWDNVISDTYYFDKIVRQNDVHLQLILNNIRLGIVNEDVKTLLDSRLNVILDNKDGIIPTLLFSKKNMVETYNKQELDKLINDNRENYTYTSYYEFSKNINDESKDFYKDLVNSQYNVDDNLKLSFHAQVMLTVNMPDHELANGSRGIIIGFENKSPIVRFLNDITLEIKPNEFVIDEGGYVVKKFQIPLILAWAITIHKAQGMSLDLVKTDIGSSIFEYGQAYVVLSRIKTIEGLSLISIDYTKIKAHPKILKYYMKLK